MGMYDQSYYFQHKVLCVNDNCKIIKIVLFFSNKLIQNLLSSNNKLL